MRHPIRLCIGIIFICFFSFAAKSQNSGYNMQREVEQTRHVRLQIKQAKAAMQKAEEQVLELPLQTTALAIASKRPIDYERLALKLDGVKYSLQADPDMPATGGRTYSNLLVFDKPVHELSWNASQLPADFYVVLIDGTMTVSQRSHVSHQHTALCDRPDAVNQSEWRAGLPAPDYTRQFSEVHNLIVHHSAGSNTATDYTQVVRDIYLYHTQEHGWSDIGYNYVVAQDGTIFKARDPAGGEQSDVKGAHFCGYNSGTMGVCMLGNYELVKVPQPQLDALAHLLTWKCKRDELNPEGVHSHPLNDQLGVIAGHRDGCATACPGDYLYQDLPAMRSQVAENLVNCGDIPVVEAPVDSLLQVVRVFPNPARTTQVNLALPTEWKDKVQKVELVSGNGAPQQASFALIKDNCLVTLPENAKAGLYLLHILVNDHWIYRKVVVR